MVGTAGNQLCSQNMCSFCYVAVLEAAGIGAHTCINAVCNFLINFNAQRLYNKIYYLTGRSAVRLTVGFLCKMLSRSVMINGKINLVFINLNLAVA